MTPEQKQEWMDKYYPTPARNFLKKLDRIDEALEHSLQKWEGLRELSEVRTSAHPIIADSRTCALCWACSKEPVETCERMCPYNIKCDLCPLASVRGGTPCDAEIEYEESLSPYGFWTVHRNSEPMIKLIEEAIEQRKKINDKA